MNCHGLEVHCITLMEQNKQLESKHTYGFITNMRNEDGGSFESTSRCHLWVQSCRICTHVVWVPQSQIEDMRDISSYGQLWIGDLFNINTYTENKMVEDMMYLWKQVLRYEGPHAFPSIAMNQFISLQIHSKLFSLYLASDSEKSKTKVPQHALEDIGLSTPSSNQRVWLKRWPS